MEFFYYYYVCNEGVDAFSIGCLRKVEGCRSCNKSSVKGENEKHDLNCIEAKFIKVFTAILLYNYIVDVFPIGKSLLR